MLFSMSESWILVTHLLILLVEQVMTAPARTLHTDSLHPQLINAIRNRRAANPPQITSVQDELQSDSKLTLVMNSDSAEEFLNEPAHANNVHSRTKRDDETSVNPDLNVDPVVQLDHQLRHRQKRSAAWMLSATIQLCNTHQHLCKSVQIEEDEVRVTLNFQDS